ncbi:ATP-binding cassette sub-family G member 4 [Armadillidium vulgare]|nr:ATP-binding cassette sub-family G member 4 [Armadillidium vulgare]
MNILAGYKTSKASGDILINGKPRCLESFRKISCYIKQDEQLLPFLTESKNTRVSNLSGGEKKRLTVAFELINNPLVMFFDEPTSGLDSYNSYQSIVYLKTLAKGDRNVICTIHQPSAKLFEQFDYVYVLAEGHCVYRGIVTNFLPFISSISLECPSHYNPADFMIEVASGVYGNFIIKMVEAVNNNFFLEHDRNNQDEINPEVNSNSNEVKQEIIIPNYEEMSPYYQSLSQKDVYVSNTVPMRIQFYILLIRTLKSAFRDPMLTLFRLGFHLISGVCIGILYFRIGNEASKMQSNVGLLLICIVFIMFTSGVTTSLTFPLEMKALIRELINNWYSLKAYYLAKTMVDIAFQIFFSQVFIIIIYIITNQPLEVKRLVTILVIGILNSLISQSLALSVGAGVDLEHDIQFDTDAV